MLQWRVDFIVDNLCWKDSPQSLLVNAVKEVLWKTGSEFLKGFFPVRVIVG